MRRFLRRFGDVTQAAYSFWLYDLCDTYLELIKPVVGDKSDENKQVCMLLIVECAVYRDLLEWVNVFPDERFFSIFCARASECVGD